MTQPSKNAITRGELLETLAAGKDFATLRGLDSQTSDFIYAIAATRAAEGHYADAEKCLRFLCLHHHNEPDFWLALARTIRLQGQFRRAISVYLIAVVLKPAPETCLELCHLYLAVGETTRARECLTAAGEHITGVQNPLNDELGRLADKIAAR